MSNFVAISKEQHANKSWSRKTSFQFAANDNLVPIVAAEIAQSAINFPLAFIKRHDAFMLVAVLSVLPGRNMFVGPKGQWIGEYIPAVLRGYPFRLATARENSNQVLCFDGDSGLIHDDPTKGEPFFDQNNEMSQQLSQVMLFLSQMQKSRVLTDLAVAALAKAGLITEWKLKLKDGDRENPVSGLYATDEEKLNALDDKAFSDLRKAQAVPVAYAQLLSMGKIQIFDKLAILHKQMSASNSAPHEEVNLDRMFGNDDLIKYD